MRLNIKLFSHLKDVLGKNVVTLNLPAGSTVEDLGEKVRSLNPEKLQDFPFRIAVNYEFATKNVILQASDEIAVIPPVQGG